MDINVNLKIEAKEIAEALKEIAACLGHQEASLPVADVKAEEPVKKTAHRKPKETKPADEPKKESVEDAPDQQEDTPIEAPEEPKINETELRAKIKSELVEMTRNGKAAGVKKLLAEYEVKKFSELAVDQLEDFLAAARNL